MKANLSAVSLQLQVIHRKIAPLGNFMCAFNIIDNQIPRGYGRSLKRGCESNDIIK